MQCPDWYWNRILRVRGLHDAPISPFCIVLSAFWLVYAIELWDIMRQKNKIERLIVVGNPSSCRLRAKRNIICRELFFVWPWRLRNGEDTLNGKIIVKNEDLNSMFYWVSMQYCYQIGRLKRIWVVKRLTLNKDASL